VPLEGARSLADPSDPERAAIASLEVAALRHAMWSLDEGQRIAITLVDIGGLSTAVAAAALGTPRGTVLSRLHRGRRSLALLLEDQVKEREP
jgi:RNA polymerase sigma-70 factor (ECF subfamily)